VLYELTEEILKITKPSGYELHAVLYKGGNDNLVIICHGGLGDKFEQGRFPFTARKLAEIGFDTLLFDFSGFGENERIPVQISNMISDLEDVWSWAKQLNYNKMGTLGLSLGGLVSLITPINDRDFAVFWAPGFYLMKSIPLYQKILGRLAPKKSKRTMKMEQSGAGSPLLFGLSFIREILDINVEDYLEKFTTPAIVIQGTADETVKPAYSKKAISLMPQDDKHILKMVEGAPHDFKEKHLNEFINFTSVFLKSIL
jgi:pimeloyl-ACP methyl ester carboxylesterase